MSETSIEIPQGSKEFVKALMTSDRTLDTQTPEMRVMPGDWVPAAWQDTAGTTRVVRTSSVVDFANYSKSIAHDVYVRFTDSPEVPIIHVGSIRVRS